MNKAPEHPGEQHKLGIVIIVVSIVFLLVSGVLWRLGNALALGGAIIFLVWGLHGLLRGALYLREGRKSQGKG